MKKKSIRISILQTFIVVILLTCGSISLNFYYGSSQSILDLSDQITKEVSEKIIERTTTFLNTPATYARVVSRLVSSPDIVRIRDELWKYMWELMMVTPYVQSIFVADTHGSYIQTRREPILATRIIDRSGEEESEHWFFRNENYEIIEPVETKEPEFDPRLRPWYRQTDVMPRNYWTDVFVFTTAQTPGISVSYPVVDEKGELMAVSCVNTPLHSLSDFIAEQKVSANGIVFIINDKDEVIAYPDKTFASRKDPQTGRLRLTKISDLDKKWIRDAYMQYQESVEQRFVSLTDGERYIANFIRFPKSFASQWKIVVIIPESDLLGSVRDMVQRAVLITLFILVLSFMVVYYVAGKIAKPIVQLAKETERIKDFRMEDVKGVESRIREVDIMSRSLLTATKGLQAFKKYVPADLVRHLIQAGQQARLGGKKAELTVFFSDIESFTHIAETMPADELMIHLSEYLNCMTNIIMDRFGTIDKYIGDAVMAFWGEPVRYIDSPRLACQAALNCQKRLKELNACWRKQGKPVLNTRMGIHTGDMIVGNVGSDKRMNYTIIGDNVNLASRLEAINKLYGTSLIISHSTYEYVKKNFICRPLDMVAVKGKSEGIRIYELIAERHEGISPEKTAFCREFKEMFSAYQSRDWEQSLSILNRLLAEYPEDSSLRLYEQRCRYFQANPHSLPHNWDGTWKLTEK